MDEKTLVFDDWAIYLANEWIKPEEGRTSLDHRELAFIDLVTYLCQFLQYDVPRHRHGYTWYFMMVLDERQYDGLCRISDYVAQGGTIPTLRHPDYPYHLHKDIFEIQTIIMFHFFDK
jgi:hypothetical protein